jgi:hypothetical protein
VVLGVLPDIFLLPFRAFLHLVYAAFLGPLSPQFPLAFSEAIVCRIVTSSESDHLFVSFCGILWAGVVGCKALGDGVVEEGCRHKSCISRKAIDTPHHMHTMCLPPSGGNYPRLCTTQAGHRVEWKHIIAHDTESLIMTLPMYIVSPHI